MSGQGLKAIGRGPFGNQASGHDVDVMADVIDDPGALFLAMATRSCAAIRDRATLDLLTSKESS